MRKNIKIFLPTLHFSSITLLSIAPISSALLKIIYYSFFSMKKYISLSLSKKENYSQKTTITTNYSRS